MIQLPHAGECRTSVNDVGGCDVVEWYGKNVFYLLLDCAETGLDRTLLVKRDSLDRRGLSLPDKELDTLNPKPIKYSTSAFLQAFEA